MARSPAGAGRLLLTAAAALWVGTAGTACGETPYSDAELERGFRLTVFDVEAGGGGGIVKKFAVPVRYRIVSSAAIDWSGTVRAFAAALDGAVAHLSLTEAAAGEAANMTIFLVDRAGYAETIARSVPAHVDRAFLERNACSAIIAARPSGIDSALVFIVVDEGFRAFSHCLVEEVAQSLGPANDSDELTDSIFNDGSELATLGVFDWFILSMLYDPRIKPGMTAAEVLPLLPAVIVAARGRLERLVTEGSPALAHALRNHGGP
jgi:hypothetical protein